MSNRLEMHKSQAIIALAKAGKSEREIAETLSVSRTAVRRHLGRSVPPAARTGPNTGLDQVPCQTGDSAAKDTKAPPGSEHSKDTSGDEAPPGSPAGSNGSVLSPRTTAADSSGQAAQSAEPLVGEAAASDSGSGVNAAAKATVALTVAAPSRSLCEPYRETIVEMVERGLTAQRIFQDLQADGFPGKYHSVRRFVRELSQAAPLPFRRLEAEPGAEMQVDYGTGARCRDCDGKLRKTHLFRAVLSCSRKGWSEAVERLTTESFIRSLENAFWALGGVPRTIVFDNAKSAVVQADWYDADINPKVIEFCKHYNTVLLTTRPRTPRHKGKIERGVGYVKSNAIKSREFESLAEQNVFLAEWERTVADTRVHGTTKAHVGERFNQIERPALGPLPAERFPYYEEGRRTVSVDGHVEVARAYYSTPPEYVGRTVWVRWNNQTLRILNDRFEQVAVHCRQEQGRRSTLNEHVPHEKRNPVEQGAELLLRKTRLLGPQAARWAEGAAAARGVAALRTIQGLLSLAGKHTAAEIDSACGRAWRSQCFHYRAVKRLLERPDGPAQQTFEFMEEHAAIRPLSEYGEFLNKAMQGG